jgi:hypothetical protein
MSDASTQPKDLAASALETAEISAWRADKKRQWPRRARLWAVRIVALAVGAVVTLGVLGAITTFTTNTLVHSMSAGTPRQK